jgi:hypothetical protein
MEGMSGDRRKPFFATICAGTRRSVPAFSCRALQRVEHEKDSGDGGSCTDDREFHGDGGVCEESPSWLQGAPRILRAYGQMRGPAIFRGNAAMSGNHGNSAYGSNSLGHIKGGNIGGGK